LTSAYYFGVICFGVNGKSPAPLVVKYHDRIVSLHLKDRAAPER
jgi:hypothetical protein